MKQAKILVLSSLLFILNSFNVSAAEISGVEFAQQIKDEGVQMELQGAGLKSVVFLKAFAAGFYKSEGIVSNMLGDFPKRIEVEYFVSIPAHKMNKFTIKSMKENVSAGEMAQIDDELVLMGEYFVNLEPGDRFSLTFIPEIGTKFVHNGKLVGTIQGETFAKALFSTWLGNEPFDKKLKKQILGSGNNQAKGDKKFIASLNN